MRSKFFLFLIILLAVILRLYKINEIPAEMWGDIVEGYKFTAEILKGSWPWYFVLGNGPLYFYLTAFLSLFLGLSFTTLKFTSGLVGIILMIGTYLLGKELFNRKIALIAVYLLAISKWPLIFSKLGNMNILVPAFIAFVFYFLVKAIKRNTLSNFILLGLFTGIGLYNYPAYLSVPATLIVIFLYFLIFDRKIIEKNLGKIVVSIIIFAIVSLPFLRLLPQFGFTNSRSYFGSKLLTSEGSLPKDFFPLLATNVVNSLSMFHIKGDTIFRINPKSEPQLDKISGIFILAGILFFLIKKKLHPYILYVLLPFFTLQLPAILVISFPKEVPSATRSIGILPFLYILTSIGIYYLWESLRFRLVRIFILVGLLIIPILNFRSVFVDYPKGLPNQNTPFGKIIAQEIDKLPPAAKIYVIGCCWGDWGQPEPNGIRFRLNTKRDLVFYSADQNLQSFECSNEVKGPTNLQYFVVNPKSDEDREKIRKCLPQGKEEMLKKNGFDIAWIYRYEE